ncbi:MAG: sigma-70 family RNA polymerase sigma factor [Deltaproteobacteria bacterium]|nr:sigma-70 family RNA polymerase sigma factor [Deltaproteobacteria bacterium]
MIDSRDHLGDGDASPAVDGGASVHVLGSHASDADILAALKAERPGAMVAFFDRYQADVNRMVWRFLGADPDHDDVVQAVFAAVLGSVHRVRDAGALRGWLLAVTANTVRIEIRRRKWRRRLTFRGGAPETLFGTQDDHDAKEALRHTYHLLEKLAVEERLVFVLRYIDDQPLDDIATACGCSLATVKRRLQRAEERFLRLAMGDPILAERLGRSKRWETP